MSSGISGITLGPSIPVGGITSSTQLSAVSSALSSGASAVTKVGALPALPPSMVTSSALGLGGNLGFDTENQLEFMKHWKETIGALGGNLLSKMPILGKYFESGETNLAELGTAMFFDPRARSKRIRITKQQQPPTTINPPASLGSFFSP